MINLLDAALDAAQNYASDPHVDEDLESMAYMGVLTSDDGRAINVMLPTDDKDPAAMARIVIAHDGIIEHDLEDFEDEDVANVLIEQIIEARDRVAFCHEALNNMGIRPEDVNYLIKKAS